MDSNSNLKETQLRPSKELRESSIAGNAEILFAVMPYISVEHPALGPSILKSCLVSRGMSTDINYFVFDFAELLGPDLYQRINVSESTALLGEWTFCEAAFGQAFDELMTKKHGRYPKWKVGGDEVDTGFSSEELEDARSKANTWIRNVVETICRRPPKILICSSMFQQNLASLAVLRGVKEKLPEVTTIVGGPNTEGILGVGLLRRASWLDYVCSGEGEETLPELCKGILSKISFTSLPVGVTSQHSVDRFAGQFNAAMPRGTLADMSKSPVPSFDDFFKALEKSQLKIRPGLVLESSRGCWWGQKQHCTFCGLNGEGMTFRAKSPQQTIAEIKILTDKHGIRSIEFADNIISLSYFKDFLPLLEKESLTMFYETKANLKEEQIKAFRKSGVRFIQPGIESLSDEVLKLMRKGTTTAINLECLRLCREYGIHVGWSIIMGFPGEREEWYLEIAQLLPKLFHLMPPAVMSDIRFDRFSPYFDNPTEWGLELTPYESYDRIYPQYLNQNNDVAYYFEKRSPNRSSLQYGLTSVQKRCLEIVEEWQKNWREEFIEYHQRPTLLIDEQSRSETKIVDTRRGTANITITVIDTTTKELLLTCRSRQSKRSLLQKFTEDRGASQLHPSELDHMLNEAISHDWIVKVSDSYLSLVQSYNSTQPGLSHFPGGFLFGEQLGQTVKHKKLPEDIWKLLDMVSSQSTETDQNFV